MPRSALTFYDHYPHGMEHTDSDGNYPYVAVEELIPALEAEKAYDHSSWDMAIDRVIHLLRGAE